MLTIGLTGGIACGKSTASAHLEGLGAFRIDADTLARQVVSPGREALAKIIEAFGSKVILPNGTLNRKALGRIVFNNASLLKKLNSIVHPHIFAEQARQIESIIKASDNPGELTIIVDAALMIEAGSYGSYDLVMVVYCPESVQLERLAIRDGFSEKQARQRILTQMPLIEKIKYANYVIDTCGSKDVTRKHINHIWKAVQLNRNAIIRNKQAGLPVTEP
jgi:dephospho-CoA kinase